MSDAAPPAPPDSASEPAPRRSGRWLLWALPAIAFVGHLPSLTNRYTTDDFELLTDNPYLRSAQGLWPLLTWELFKATGSPKVSPYWRPISGLLNWVSYQLLGTNPVLQHLLNLVLYAAVGLLLAGLLRRLRYPPAAVLTLGAWVLLHPVMSESVAYVQGRQDLLGLAFVLAAMGIAASTRSLAVAATAVFLGTLLGGASREFWLLGAPMIALVGLDAARGGRRELARLGVLFGAGALAVGVFLGLRRVLAIMPVTPAPVTPGERLGAWAATGARLMRDVFAPNQLVWATVPPWPVGAAVGLGICATGLAVALVIGTWRVRPAQLGGVLAGLVLIAASATTQSEILLRFGYVCDRYALSILLGLALAIGPLLTDRLERWTHQPQSRLARAWPWLPGAAAFALLPMTWAQDKVHHDDTSLMRYAVAVRPNDPESMFSSAMLAFDEGRVNEALETCRALERVKPTMYRARQCIAAAHVQRGDVEGALPYLRADAEGHPGLPSNRVALLNALIASGRFDEIEANLARWEPYFGQSPEIVRARRLLEQRRHPAATDARGREP